MWHTLQKKTLSVWALVLVAVAGCLVSVNCFADDTDAGIKEFKKPTVFNTGEMDLNNIEERMYKARGIVDAVNEKAIVIGDIQYTISPGTPITCPVGAFVGIKVDDRGDVIACEKTVPLTR